MKTQEQVTTVEQMIKLLQKCHPNAPIAVWDGTNLHSIKAVVHDWPDLPPEEAAVELHI